MRESGIFSAEAEHALLGTILMSESVEPADGLDISAMYLDSNRQILTVIRALNAQGHQVNTLTVANDLERQGRLSAVGGRSYVLSLTEGLPRRMNVEPYVRIIKEKAALRSILAMCDSLAARAELEEPSSEILHDMQATAIAYQSAAVTVRPTPIAELIVPAWETMRFQRNFNGDVLGIPTGVPELDRETTGWRDGELTYVGALPGRGKTSFLLQSMFHAAMQGFGVGCISLEMRSGQLIRRLAIMKSGIHAMQFRDVRKMNQGDFEHTKHSLFALGELPITICDQSGLKPSQIASVARQMVAKGAQIIFVDFVQIIQEDGKDRREAINRVSAALRDTCKSLNKPFVVASQLARRDSDPNRRPTIQDLRESGNLEQDAHNVFLLYRPKSKETGDWTGEDEIIIDKQREGMTGKINVRYDDCSLSYVGREQ